MDWQFPTIVIHTWTAVIDGKPVIVREAVPWDEVKNWRVVTADKPLDGASEMK